MIYTFPSTVSLVQANAVRLVRMDVDWELARVSVHLNVLAPGGTIVQSRAFEFTVGQLDQVLGLPGATMEERILRGLVAVASEIPDGGTFGP